MTLYSDHRGTHRSAKHWWGSSISVADVARRLAPISGPALRISQRVLLVVTVGLIGTLAVLAAREKRTWPRPLEWLGQGGDWVPVALVTAVIALLCINTWLLRRDRSSAAAQVMIVIGLTVTSLILGFSSYWSCNNGRHPTFISPLLWTVSLVKGGLGDENLDSGVCPQSMPTALEVARLTIVAAIFISLVGVAAAAFRAQYDRLRATWARSVTVVVDLDDDSASMISGIARTLRPGSTLVLMTDDRNRACVTESRRHAARVLQVDFDDPDTVVAHKFWRRLNRLYLLSADPSTNLLRLSAISQSLAPMTTKRRVPLIVRIDDPWLAETWRTQQFGHHGGGSDHLWAADTVSKYETTARRLIDQILDNRAIRRLIVCGASQLTLALCAEMALRHTERRFLCPEGEPELPTLTLIASDADAYARDHEARYRRRRLGSDPPPVEPVTAAPTAPEISTQVDQAESEDATTAVIVVDTAAAADPTLGTRLAASHPTMPIYMWDPAARLNTERTPVAGELRTYRLGMDLPDGHALDNFERTAMLIHEHYASSQADRTQPASLPWERLSDFYQDSNRRQLGNALWMVEKIAGHTWKTADTPENHISPESLEQLDAVGDGRPVPPGDPAEVAVKKLQRLGFSEDTIYAMAQAEWEGWSRYLRERGWTLGDKRSIDNKQHERLVDSWDATLADPQLKAVTLTTLADTQIALAKLQRLGFSEDTAYAMAKEEWDEWSRYLSKQGWTLGDKRNIENKRHERLVDSWAATTADPQLKAVALTSLADTQIALAKLQRLGFSEDAAYAMAQKEWEDWSRYLSKHKWTLGNTRDEPNKKNEKLVADWEATAADPQLKAAALRSLAGTLIELMKLGYRSRPMWQTYERVGTVTAKRRRKRWAWITASGNTAYAPARTWEVSDCGHSWPVRNDIFHASYRRQDESHWERQGTVLAREARPGETIHTLEGPVTAAEGDWVIQGDRGEQWPVSADEFRRRYRGPVPVYKGPKVPTAQPQPAGALPCL
ncbi:MAG: hypothetical protein ACLPLP_15445 [Mycobacterium sp.]